MSGNGRLKITTRSTSKKEIGLLGGSRPGSAFKVSDNKDEKQKRLRATGVIPFDNAGVEQAALAQSSSSSGTTQEPENDNLSTAATDGVEDGDAQLQIAPQVITVTDSAPVLEGITGKQIKAFTSKYRHYAIANNGVQRPVYKCIPENFHGLISDVVASDPDLEHLADVWFKASDQELLQFLDRQFPEEATSDIPTFLKKEITKCWRKWKPLKKTSMVEIVQKIHSTLLQYKDEMEDAVAQKNLVKALMDSITSHEGAEAQHEKISVARQRLADFMKRDGVPETVSLFNRKLLRCATLLSEAYNTLDLFELGPDSRSGAASTPTGGGGQNGGGQGHLKRKFEDKNKNGGKPKEASNKVPKVTAPGKSCNHCGWDNHATSECGMKTHKFANPDANIAWADSEAGKKAKLHHKDKLRPNKGESFLAILYGQII